MPDTSKNKLTLSQQRNLVALYLWPALSSVNGNTWPGLQQQGLVESDHKTYARCTPEGRLTAAGILNAQIALLKTHR